MATATTRGDSIRAYLTGAASHGGAQTNPNLSLGNFMSASRAFSLNPFASIVNVNGDDFTIDEVSPANGVGTGVITLAGTNIAKWTAPSGTLGAAVTVGTGATMVLEDGADPNKWIRVTRIESVATTGSANVVIGYMSENLVGFDLVSAAEQAAGDAEYRCIAFKCVNAAGITNLTVRLKVLGTQVVSGVGQLGASGAGTIETAGNFNNWPSSGFVAIKTNAPALREVAYYSSRTSTVLTVPAAGRAQMGTSAAAGASTDTLDAIPGIMIGLDAPTSQPSGSFVDNTGGTEQTVPAGVTFSVPITVAEALSIGTLTVDQIYGIWMKRIIVAGATSGLSFVNQFLPEYDAV